MSAPQLSELLRAATPGRWIVSKGPTRLGLTFHGITALGVGSETIRTHVSSDLWPADAALICAAVNELPALLDERTKLRETLAAALRRLDSHYEDQRCSGDPLVDPEIAAWWAVLA